MYGYDISSNQLLLLFLLLDRVDVSRENDLFFSNVIHRAAIEEGTEAAAVTGWLGQYIIKEPRSI